MPVSTTAYVDSYHASNKVIRRGHTGFIVFLNMALIIWYCNKQNTVEESTFSSDFIADKYCVEHITALCFKLRMLVIPVVDSTKILCDNESVVNNSSILSSALNKKQISIAYHFVRWCVSAGVIKVVCIEINANLAGVVTIRLTAEKRGGLFLQ